MVASSAVRTVTTTLLYRASPLDAWDMASASTRPGSQGGSFEPRGTVPRGRLRKAVYSRDKLDQSRSAPVALLKHHTKRQRSLQR